MDRRMGKMDNKVEYLEEKRVVLRERATKLEQNYSQVRDSYQNEYGWPELDTIRYEITLCLMFGLHQAAITLTNHLLESAMKYTLIAHNSKGQKEKHTSLVSGLINRFEFAIQKYGNIDLAGSINAVARAGLISKQEKKILHEYRTHLRNAYSHADKKKTFRGGTVPVQAADIKDGKFKFEKPERVKIDALPIVLSLPENDLKNIFLGNFLQPSNGNPLPTINQPPHIEILL